MYVKFGPIGRKNRAETVIIDNYDVWNLDHTLALIIVPALKRLKEVTHGAPFVDNVDVPEDLQTLDNSDLGHWHGTSSESEKCDDDNYFKRWNWVLDEMIWAFQSKLEDWDEQFFTKSNKIFDKKGFNSYFKRINNGFRLFGKYYNGIWD